jgi:hypothetical protein
MNYSNKRYADGCGGGMIIGLPPVVNFGNKALRERIVPAVLAGEKYIALAISEAFAGSDVAGLKTVAVKSADGTHFIVNGTPKEIKKKELKSGSREECMQTISPRLSRRPRGSQCC